MPINYHKQYGLYFIIVIFTLSSAICKPVANEKTGIITNIYEFEVENKTLSFNDMKDKFDLKEPCKLFGTVHREACKENDLKCKYMENICKDFENEQGNQMSEIETNDDCERFERNYSNANYEQSCYGLELNETEAKNNLRDNRAEEGNDCNLYGLRDEDGGGYIMDVVIGTPGQWLKVMIDTRSPYLAISGSFEITERKFFDKIESKTLLIENQNLSSSFRFGTWKGYLTTDVVSFPKLNFDEEFRSKIVVINDSMNAFDLQSEYQGLLGLSYPRDVFLNPFSSSNSLIDSLQRSIQDKDLAVLLELCGNVNKANTTYKCGYIDVLENKMDNSAERERLKNILFVANTEIEWSYEFQILGVKIGTERFRLQDPNSKRTKIDTTTTDIHIPTEIFSRLVLTLILKTGFPVDDNFWYAGDERCWNDMIGKFPSIEFQVEYTEKSYFTIAVPSAAYLRQVEKNNSGPCYRFAFQASNKGTYFGLAALEGQQIILGRKSVGFMRSHCGPVWQMWGPTWDGEEDKLRKFASRDNLEIFYMSFLYVAVLFMTLFLLYALCVWAAQPGWVYLTRC